MVEFTVKPVEIYGAYTSTQSPTQYTSSITHLQTDIYGNLKTQGISPFYSSTAGVQPTVIAGVDNSGSIVPWNSTSGTLKVDTEMLLAADNVTISNIKPFIQVTGTQTFGLVDSSTRIILSPTSTIEISTTSTIHFDVGSTVQAMTPTDINNTTGTIGVVRLTLGSTVNFMTGTVGFPTSSTVNIPVTSTVNFPVSSTVQIMTPTNLANTTGTLGMVGLILGSTINFTTGTVGFPVSSTVNIPVTSTINFPVTSSVNIGTTGTVGFPVSSTINFPVTSTVNFPVTSSINIGTTGSISFATVTSTVNFPVTSTVNIGVGSTINFATTSSVNIASIAPQTSTALGLVVNGGTIGVETEFAIGSTFSIYPFTSSSFSFINTNSTVNFPVSSSINIGTTGTVGITGFSAVTSTVNFPVTSSINIGTTGSISFSNTTSTVQAMTPPNLNNTTGTIGVVRLTLGSTVEINTPAALNNTTGTLGVVRLTLGSTVNWDTTSTLGAAVSWATGATVNVSYAPDLTSTINVRIIGISSGLTGTVPTWIGTNGTVNFTTGTVGISGGVTGFSAVTSTVNFPVTSTVNFSVGSTVQTSWAATSTMNVLLNTTATIPVSFSVGSTINFAITSTVQNLYAGVGYTPVSKYVVFTAATALASVWIPTLTKKWYMSDLIISASTSSDVTLIDTTATLVTFTFDNRGGAVSNFRTPLVSALTNGTLKIATSAGSCSFLASGWEAA